MWVTMLGLCFLLETLDSYCTTETIESVSSKIIESNSEVDQYGNSFVTKGRSRMLNFKVIKDMDA